MEENKDKLEQELEEKIKSEEEKEREEFEKDIAEILMEQEIITNKKSKKKKIIFGTIAATLGVLVIGTGILGYQISENKIAKGVYISNQDMGGLTQEQALKKLEEKKMFEKLSLKYGEDTYIVTSKSIELNIDKKKMVKEAYDFNRESNIAENLLRTLKSDFGSKVNINVAANYNKEMLNNVLKDIKERVDKPVKNATMEYVDEKAVMVPDQPGQNLDLQASLNNIDKALAKDEFESKLVVNLEKAKFTAADLKGIDTLLGGYSTTFYGMPGRDYNIAKSANDSGNILLKPGEEFSFNGILGEKSIANGYKSAPVISDGKLVLGVGGGVCQTSSTIFNAALLSGMEITDRRAHTIPSGYVSLGRDATIVDGRNGQDLKFKNPFEHPVFVKNYAKDGKVVSQIYGFKSDFKNISIATQTLGSFGGGSKTVTDPSLKPGQKVVEKYARAGYNVATYRIYKDENGKVIKSERVANSRYPAQTGLIRVGPAAAPAVPAKKPATTLANNQ